MYDRLVGFKFIIAQDFNFFRISLSDRWKNAQMFFLLRIWRAQYDQINVPTFRRKKNILIIVRTDVVVDNRPDRSH